MKRLLLLITLLVLVPSVGWGACTTLVSQWGMGTPALDKAAGCNDPGVSYVGTKVNLQGIAAHSICSVKVKLYKHGTPGDVKLAVYTNVDGTPVDKVALSAAVASSAITGTTLATANTVNFNFSSPYTTTEGIDVWFAIESQTPSWDNFYYWVTSDTTYKQFETKLYENSTWNNADYFSSFGLSYEIYTDTELSSTTTSAGATTTTTAAASTTTSVSGSSGWVGNVGRPPSNSITDLTTYITQAASKTGEVTILLNTGTTTWTSDLEVDMTSMTNVTALNIIGAGAIPTGTTTGAATTGGTTINLSGVDINMTGSAAKKFRVSNITFTGSASNAAVDISGTSKPSSGGGWRVDHITGNNSGRIVLVIGITYGVVDHCYRLAGGQVFEVYGGGGGQASNDLWNQDFATYYNGTSNKVFFEDNEIYCDTGCGSPIMFCDESNGGSVVIRHNKIRNHYIGGHDSRQNRGNVWTEIYDNVFTSTGNSGMSKDSFDLMGGSGVVYNNNIICTASSLGQCFAYNSNSGIHFISYRADSCNSGAHLDLFAEDCTDSQIARKGCLGAGATWRDTYCTSDADCGGVSGSCVYIDDQDGDGKGYPCRDQIGRTANNVLKPYLLWNNTVKLGSSAAIPVTVGVDDCCSSYIQINTDYCVSDTTMPTKCPATIGVATVYTAYTYPHPLATTSSFTIFGISGDGVVRKGDTGKIIYLSGSNAGWTASTVVSFDAADDISNVVTSYVSANSISVSFDVAAGAAATARTIITTTGSTVLTGPSVTIQNALTTTTTAASTTTTSAKCYALGEGRRGDSNVPLYVWQDTASVLTPTISLTGGGAFTIDTVGWYTPYFGWRALVDIPIDAEIKTWEVVATYDEEVVICEATVDTPGFNVLASTTTSTVTGSTTIPASTTTTSIIPPITTTTTVAVTYSCAPQNPFIIMTGQTLEGYVIADGFTFDAGTSVSVSPSSDATVTIDQDSIGGAVAVISLAMARTAEIGDRTVLVRARYFDNEIECLTPVNVIAPPFTVPPSYTIYTTGGARSLQIVTEGTAPSYYEYSVSGSSGTTAIAPAADNTFRLPLAGFAGTKTFSVSACDADGVCTASTPITIKRCQCEGITP